MSGVVPGSCLCGAVRFEVTLPFRRANYCHCSRCRKHSGAFALPNGRVRADQLRVLQGEELIGVWQPPDEGGRKAFCTRCGASLFGNRYPEGPIVSVRLGALDEDPGIRPQFHMYVGSKAAWEELVEDELPRYPEQNEP